MEYTVSIPNLAGTPAPLILRTGESIVIVGANGSGKTRLGVRIETGLPPLTVQRIGAQKSLSLIDNVNLVSFERATKTLRYGNEGGNEGQKHLHRWGNKPAIHFLNDFLALLQALFANHNKVASDHLRERKTNPNIPVPVTQLERLKGIWDQLLPHRSLEVNDASIQVHPTGATASTSYAGSEMSDGERAIFYFLGQCLLAPKDGVVIIDEPEAHIHNAILNLLWDAIEKARHDCCFVYITHDLGFATSHSASSKYFVRSYEHSTQRWDLEKIPFDTGLPERVVVELVGSRKPILFVEGTAGSIDQTVYRAAYSQFTIVPIGSCEAVIQSVASFNRSAVLHRVSARGLVDADDRDSSDIQYLRRREVFVLPVAEVENALLLPNVFVALAHALMCAEPTVLLEGLTTQVMARAAADIDAISARQTMRQIDRRLKKVELSATDLASLQTVYQAQITSIDVAALFANYHASLSQCIASRNLQGVLRLYDNKGLLAMAAGVLGLRDQKHLLEKVGRLLGGEQGHDLLSQLSVNLPVISQ